MPGKCLDQNKQMDLKKGVLHPEKNKVNFRSGKWEGRSVRKLDNKGGANKSVSRKGMARQQR